MRHPVSASVTRHSHGWTFHLSVGEAAGAAGRCSAAAEGLVAAVRHSGGHHSEDRQAVACSGRTGLHPEVAVAENSQLSVTWNFAMEYLLAVEQLRVDERKREEDSAQCQRDARHANELGISLTMILFFTTVSELGRSSVASFM